MIKETEELENILRPKAKPKKQSHYAQTLADNKDLIEETIKEAKENEAKINETLKVTTAITELSPNHQDLIYLDINYCKPLMIKECT